MSSFLQAGRPSLILASSSKSRAEMLEAAGVAFIVEPPGLDEATMRQAISGEGSLSPHDVAEVLARAKAEAVSDLAPKAYVIGADQTLALGNRRFSKPVNRDEASQQLHLLRGQTHVLHSALALVRDGAVLFEFTDTARLTMRDFSDRFLDDYLDMAGDAALSSVGGYQLEGIGIHLFEKVEGDYFTILGLPLLPLLAFMRQGGFVDG